MTSPFEPGAIDQRSAAERAQAIAERIAHEWTVFAWTYWLGLLTLVILIGIPVLLVAIVYSCVLMYRFWDLVYRLDRRISPLQAVAFCFVPLWNIYWSFVAYRGLARRYNAYAERRRLPVEPIATGLITTYCVLAATAIIPYLGWALMVVALIIYFFVLRRLKNRALVLAPVVLEEEAQVG